MLWKGHSNKTNLKDVSGCDYFLGFGHRRLSILDLSECGHQPMVDEGLGLAVVFNGAIYNYIEIEKNCTIMVMYLIQHAIQKYY